MSIGLAVLFALLTALSNAVALSTQHAASTGGDPTHRGSALVLYLIRQPLWWLGWIAMGSSLVFQAIALHFGPLSLVQPLLVGELVLALLIRRLWLHQVLRRAAWTSAALTTAALITFLVATSPHGVAGSPAARDWTGPTLTVALLVAVSVMVARRGSPSRRAGAYAGATALIWALEATFIKATADVLASHGLSTTLTSWPLYALVGCGVIGLMTEQAALHVGPLKISQPIIVIVDPVASVLLGIVLYRERLASSPGSLIVEAVSFAMVALGVVAMTRTVPDTATLRRM